MELSSFNFLRNLDTNTSTFLLMTTMPLILPDFFHQLFPFYNLVYIFCKYFECFCFFFGKRNTSALNFENIIVCIKPKTA
jgi:hypothetical protein